ncbi:PQQ-binding-like beta-propeller repeat protein [Bacteriovorax stolpii]|uniref:PQQ-binding-like beta-propeller repeat protein n=1 Tax=Bacteriovorax stolpii TaxID=960 RepID=UPI00163CB44E|nr:PQQ-binding-like beta-propeller repeat protein [Bacteriovorax stolpii]
MDVLHWLISNHEAATRGIEPAIIPTVLIPLTAVTVALSSLAGLIAGWFGIKLNTEGPKQFLEVLLKKRVIFSMILMNLLGLGIYRSYIYVKTLPSFISTIEWNSKRHAIPSTDAYTESRMRPHDYYGAIAPAQEMSVRLVNEQKIPAGAFRSAAISNHSLFYGSDDGRIYEIDQKDLKTKRTFFIGEQVTTRPVIFNGHIYTGEGTHLTHHARIYSFDLKTGQFTGAFQTKGHTEGQPIIVTKDKTDFMLVPAGSDGLYAVDPNSLKEIWHVIDGHIDGTVSVEKNIVYIGTGVEKGKQGERSFAIARDLVSSKLFWKKELPLSSWMHPIITRSDVCYVLGEIYLPSKVGLVYCLDKKTGTPHFSIPFDAPIASKPFFISEGDNEYLYLATMQGEVCGININKKEKMWCQQTKKDQNFDAYALTSLEFDPQRGTLWYPSADNGIFGFSAKEGQILAHWNPSKNETPWNENYAAVNVVGDKIFHIDIKGNMRMLEISDRERMQAPLAGK